LCQERARGVRCCIRDEGRGPFGAGFQEQAPNSRELLLSKGGGGERPRKRREDIASCMGWRDERKQTTDKASKDTAGIKTGALSMLREEHGGMPGDWPCGARGRGGVTPVWALVRNLRTCSVMRRDKAQAVDPRGRKYRCAGQGRTIP
jgi:hypothetical protein